MSISAELMFLEYEPGKWVFFEENSMASKNNWDWREDSICYGPYNSLQEAEEDQYNNGPSTSGHEVVVFDPERKEDRFVLDMIQERIDHPQRRDFDRVVHRPRIPGAF